MRDLRGVCYATGIAELAALGKAVSLNLEIPAEKLGKVGQTGDKNTATDPLYRHC